MVWSPSYGHLGGSVRNAGDPGEALGETTPEVRKTLGGLSLYIIFCQNVSNIVPYGAHTCFRKVLLAGAFSFEA